MKYHNIFLFFTITFFLIVLTNCQEQSSVSSASTTLVDSTYLQNVLEELGSDKYMGRMPGTAAEPLTINYIRAEFEKIGYTRTRGS